MSDDLRSLYRAFELLEQQADAAPVSPIAVRAPASRRMVRAAAPVGAAALVLAGVTTTALVWPQPERNPAGGGAVSPVSTAPVIPPPPVASPSPVSTAPATSPLIPPGELAAEARGILAGIATITVRTDKVPVPTPVHSDEPTAPPFGTPTDTAGKYFVVFSTPLSPRLYLPPPTSVGKLSVVIQGTMTSADGTSQYALKVGKTDPAAAPSCADQWGPPGRLVPNCSVQQIANGTYAVARSENDRGGSISEIAVVRSDGTEIDLRLVTGRYSGDDGQVQVTAGQLPLSEAQMIAFVTSDKW